MILAQAAYQAEPQAYEISSASRTANVSNDDVLLTWFYGGQGAIILSDKTLLALRDFMKGKDEKDIDLAEILKGAISNE